MADRFPWLNASLPNGQSCKWLLEKEVVIIGREEPADLALPYMAVSRRHAQISLVDGVCCITDLGSRNGTFLNGNPIGTDPQRLRDGDIIVLGGAVTLRFNDPGGTAENPRVGRLEGVWIDPGNKDVWVDAHRVEPPLSTSQLALLELLFRTAGRVVSRAEMITAVWPGDDPRGVSEEAVDSLIKRLRARLRQAQPEREYIELIRGHGARLIIPEG